jgi:hypothetical protein
MEKLLYLYNKFSSAVSCMATSPKTIQERVGDAYIYHLEYLKTEDLPEEIRFKFGHMVERLTKYKPAKDEGSIQATISQMSTHEAMEIAKDIVSMGDIVNSKYRIMILRSP